MAFKVSDYKNTTFMAVIKDTSDNVIDEVKMMDLSYNRWNEIGLMVVPKVAPKIKNPDKPSEVIADIKTQNYYDQEAEVLRNVMRIVESLEGGDGIDWEDDPPATLEAKARRLQDTSTPIIVGLLGILQKRVFGGKVSVKDAHQIFPDVSESSSNGVSPETMVG